MAKTKADRKAAVRERIRAEKAPARHLRSPARTVGRYTAPKHDGKCEAGPNGHCTRTCPVKAAKKILKSKQAQEDLEEEEEKEEEEEEEEEAKVEEEEEEELEAISAPPTQQLKRKSALLVQEKEQEQRQKTKKKKTDTAFSSDDDDMDAPAIHPRAISRGKKCMLLLSM